MSAVRAPPRTTRFSCSRAKLLKIKKTGARHLEFRLKDQVVSGGCPDDGKLPGVGVGVAWYRVLGSVKSPNDSVEAPIFKLREARDFRRGSY